MTALAPCAAPPARADRPEPRPPSSGAFPTRAASRRWWLIFSAVALVGLVMCVGLLVWNNPMEPGTRGFWLIAKRRAIAVVAIGVVAVSQSMATVAFQTVAANRIITPSILGFESLYRAIHTSTVFFFGVSGLTAARTIETFLVTLVLMVAMCLVLYTWLLTSRSASLHAMLLIGVVLGTGLGSVSSLMQRLLTPSEFDVLTARLFGSVANADAEYYPVAVPLVLACATGLALMTRRLDVLALGRDAAIGLGVDHRRTSVVVLVLVSILMATSTALVGPMTFLGFLVATLAHQFSATYDHRRIFAMSVALAVAVLAGAYFIMNHVFDAQGVVSIIIELVGGLTFIAVVLTKGRL
ncbi:iron chelate uptake ABC transporter family permease subunit [Actinomyces sp. B33]|uniref:iron chelate uptake ABC transporter family permease subunit n=1 Tax=Actinomyces sp. B33 TaxID=2942131 RepID=UPI002340433D|nr:iron chelate uptake ABC transporter family permease subunit [Actinomyces sp. B33]MDC4233929.1 iron chelate uptake ABC transporter family permease subunit [Actinomyces sp. B33]